MDILNWIPAVSTTALFAGVLWLMRSVISTRLAKSVQHEFDKKLEEIRSEQRKIEESFKVDLRKKENQIEALRNSAMTGMISRQAILDKKRVEAVEEIWLAVLNLAPAKATSLFMASIKFEAATKEAAKNPQLRILFETMGGSADLKKMSSVNAAKARLFVSEMAWAIFSAYYSILHVAVAQVHILKSGLDIPNLLNVDSINKIVKAVLPHQAEYLEKYGSSGYHWLVDDLESLLLKELQNNLKGIESDKDSIVRAAEILKESERISSEISKQLSNEN